MASADWHALQGCFGMSWLAATTRHAGRHRRCCHSFRLWLRLPPMAPLPLLAATPPFAPSQPSPLPQSLAAALAGGRRRRSRRVCRRQGGGM